MHKRASAFRWPALAAAAGTAVRWAWGVGPGILGAAGISIAAGGLVQTFAHQGGVWVAVAVASLFALAIDLRG